ncbi:MAG: hypothetical protein NWS82_05030, partial [Burkholderiaceae bacterium]|nr:hypothetical protein [Burkholderiaceae bacterium]
AAKTACGALASPSRLAHAKAVVNRRVKIFIQLISSFVIKKSKQLYQLLNRIPLPHHTASTPNS